MKSWPAIDIVIRAAPAEGGSDLPGFLAAFLDDFSPTAIVDLPPAADGAAEGAAAVALAWRVFFGSTEARAAAATAVSSSGEWATRVAVTAVDVDDEQWAERSQAEIAAIRVGRVIVTPPWDVARARRMAREAGRGKAGAESAAKTRLTIVEIEPSMGFGTGHHESTRLCLRALQEIDVTGRQVLDLGTGSGVLAIATALLGCARAIAIDDDRDALDAAEGNVRRNGVSAHVELRLASLAAAAAGGSDRSRADVVVANLTGALLRRDAQLVMPLVAPDGFLILGGFTLDERLAVLHAFASFVVVREHTENGWAALTLRPSH